MECGFTVGTDVFVTALEKQIPAAEREYIHHRLNYPRALLLLCRDAIRNYHKRRQLHRFLDYPMVPEKIKDFVLLKCYFDQIYQ